MKNKINKIGLCISPIILTIGILILALIQNNTSHGQPQKISATVKNVERQDISVGKFNRRTEYTVTVEYEKKDYKLDTLSNCVYREGMQYDMYYYNGKIYVDENSAKRADAVSQYPALSGISSVFILLGAISFIYFITAYIQGRNKISKENKLRNADIIVTAKEEAKEEKEMDETKEVLAPKGKPKITIGRYDITFTFENGYVLKASGEILYTDAFLCYKDSIKNWEPPHDNEPVTPEQFEELVKQVNNRDMERCIPIEFG